MLLDPDPHSQYGSEFRTAKSMRIRIQKHLKSVVFFALSCCMVCSILGCAQARSVSGSPPLNHERVFAGTHAHANLGFPPVSQNTKYRENFGFREDIRPKESIKHEKNKKKLLANQLIFNTKWSPRKKTTVLEVLSDHWSFLLELWTSFTEVLLLDEVYRYLELSDPKLLLFELSFGALKNQCQDPDSKKGMDPDPVYLDPRR